MKDRSSNDEVASEVVATIAAVIGRDAQTIQPEMWLFTEIPRKPYLGMSFEQQMEIVRRLDARYGISLDPLFMGVYTVENLCDYVHRKCRSKPS
jgi:hypothetical protein